MQLALPTNKLSTLKPPSLSRTLGGAAASLALNLASSDLKCRFSGDCADIGSRNELARGFDDLVKEQLSLLKIAWKLATTSPLIYWQKEAGGDRASSTLSEDLRRWALSEISEAERANSIRRDTSQDGNSTPAFGAVSDIAGYASVRSASNCNSKLNPYPCVANDLEILEPDRQDLVFRKRTHDAHSRNLGDWLVIYRDPSLETDRSLSLIAFDNISGDKTNGYEISSTVALVENRAGVRREICILKRTYGYKGEGSHLQPIGEPIIEIKDPNNFPPRGWTPREIFFGTVPLVTEIAASLDPGQAGSTQDTARAIVSKIKVFLAAPTH